MTRILVVDDDEQVRTLIRHTLEGEGYRVDEAPDGKVAARLTREDPAVLLILNIYMPDMDGIETIRELRKSQPLVKIIAISGGGGRFDFSPLKVAETLGVKRTLSKPIPSELLVSCVREVLAE